jgi:nucleotide-binding universal stress UspA family protein
VLLANHWRIPGAPAILGPELEQAAQDQADLAIAEAVAEARAVAPTVAVRGHAVLGDPAPALMSAGFDGGLIVVGSRGQSGFPAALLGPVSQQVALHAHGPVVVVRGKTEPAEGPVVAGFDGSPGADEALRTAFEAASLRGGRLTVVQAVTATLPSWPVSLPPLAYDRDAVRLATQAELEHALAPWTEKVPRRYRRRPPGDRKPVPSTRRRFARRPAHGRRHAWPTAGSPACCLARSACTSCTTPNARCSWPGPSGPCRSSERGTTMNKTQLIIVGVDGSEGSRLALRWAVAEAQRSGGAVKAVTAWYWQGLEGDMLAVTNPREQEQHAERISVREVEAVVAEFGSETPIAREVVEGVPVRVLIDASRQARMLVLGSHGHGRLHRAVLGSVSDECARQARCPVVIIPTPRAEKVKEPAEPVAATP